MDYKTYVKTVTEGVKAELGESIDVSLTKTVKNNLTLEGLVCKGECEAAPVIYISDQYDPDRDNTQDIIKYVCNIYRDLSKSEHRIAAPGNELFDWKYVKDRVKFMIVSEAGNEALLMDKPYLTEAGLALVFYIELGSAVPKKTVKITNSHLKALGVTVDDLYEAAKGNMKRFHIDSIGHIIEGILGEGAIEGKHPEMYVLSSEDWIFGAAQLLVPDVMSEIGGNLGVSKATVFPSSIHEAIILVGDENDQDFDYLAQMVKTINNEAVNLEEKLSDNVFVYDFETNTLTIAA